MLGGVLSPWVQWICQLPDTRARRARACPHRGSMPYWPHPRGGRARVTELHVRPAGLADAAAIAAIYNQGIAERIATFETEPRSAQQIAGWLGERARRYPVVVAERGGA